MQINYLVEQLRDKGFKVKDSRDGNWVSVVKDDLYDHSEIISLNKHIPYLFSVQDEIIYQDLTELEVLLPMVFNYILQNLSAIENGSLRDKDDERQLLEQEREQLMSDVLAKKGQDQQYLMDQLTALDRKLDISDEYTQGNILRLVDLFAILKEYGYTESVLEGTKLTVVKDNHSLVRVDTESQMDIQTLPHFAQLKEEERIKLQLLITAFGATPIKVRKLPYSFLEQAIIASLPGQYKWIKRENTTQGVKLYAYSGLSPVSVKEEVICDPHLFRMATLKNHLPTYMPRTVPSIPK